MSIYTVFVNGKKKENTRSLAARTSNFAGSSRTAGRPDHGLQRSRLHICCVAG
jgi:hypothetical protein